METDSFISVWGHSVHFRKFPMIYKDFQRATASPVFIQFQPNGKYMVYNHGNHGGMQAVSGDLPNF